MKFSILGVIKMLTICNNICSLTVALESVSIFSEKTVVLRFAPEKQNEMISIQIQMNRYSTPQSELLLLAHTWKYAYSNN